MSRSVGGDNHGFSAEKGTAAHGTLPLAWQAPWSTELVWQGLDRRGDTMLSAGGTENAMAMVSSWFDWIPSWLLDYSSFEETENEDLESIGIVAGYNVALAFIFWLYWTCKWCSRIGGGGREADAVSL